MRDVEEREWIPRVYSEASESTDSEGPNRSPMKQTRHIMAANMIRRVHSEASESTASEGPNWSPMKYRRHVAASMKQLQAQRDAPQEDALFKGAYVEEDMKAVAERNAGKIQAQVATLEEKCQALQATAGTTRNENAIFKMRTTIAMGSMKLTTDSLIEDNEFLIEKCQIFEGKIAELRRENASKQNRINKLEVEATLSTFEGKIAELRRIEYLQAKPNQQIGG